MMRDEDYIEEEGDTCCSQCIGVSQFIQQMRSNASCQNE